MQMKMASSDPEAASRFKDDEMQRVQTARDGRLKTAVCHHRRRGLPVPAGLWTGLLRRQDANSKHWFTKSFLQGGAMLGVWAGHSPPSFVVDRMEWSPAKAADRFDCTVPTSWVILDPYFVCILYYSKGTRQTALARTLPLPPPLFLNKKKVSLKSRKRIWRRRKHDGGLTWNVGNRTMKNYILTYSRL